MKTRTLALAMAALGLTAWVDPKTAAPEVSKDAAAAEAKQQAIYLVNTRLKEIRRVEDIAFRLEVANQDLCADRRPRIGASLTGPEMYDRKVRDAAIETLKLGDGATVRNVTPGSPAAIGGLKAGDLLVSLNGEPLATGKDALPKVEKRLVDVIGQSTAPLSLGVRRGEATETLSVAPVMACSYGVVVEDGEEINAFADGHAIHVERPILRVVGTDEELALVIAHELAHNGQHHIQAELHNGRIFGVPGFALDVIAAAYGVNTNGAFTKAGMRVGLAHANVEFEAEADYVGMYYMARAGYAIDGVADFWRKMAVENPEAIFIKTDHPASPERFLAISATAKEIEAKRAKGEPLTPNQKPG